MVNINDEYYEDFGRTASEIDLYRSLVFFILLLIIGIPVLVIGFLIYNADQGKGITFIIFGSFFIFLGLITYIFNKIRHVVVKKNKKAAKYYGVYKKIRK